MLARIAHELYWLGRYLARAEHTGKMLDGVFHADLQSRVDDPASMPLSWDALLAIMGASTRTASAPSSRDEVISALTVDPASPVSVVTCIERARTGANAVRDVISEDMWEVVNAFHLRLRHQDLSAAMRTGPYSIYELVKERCAIFWGLVEGSMLRDEARAFLLAGEQIESADMVLRMARVALPDLATNREERDSMPEDGRALGLLSAVGGFQAYRRSVPAPPTADSVARFLLFESEYPDSVSASVDHLHRLLSRADDDPGSSPPVLRLGRLRADLEFRASAAGQGRELAGASAHVQEELTRVDRDVAERYFSGAEEVPEWEVAL